MPTSPRFWQGSPMSLKIWLDLQTVCSIDATKRCRNTSKIPASTEVLSFQEQLSTLKLRNTILGFCSWKSFILQLLSLLHEVCNVLLNSTTKTPLEKQFQDSKEVVMTSRLSHQGRKDGLVNARSHCSAIRRVHLQLCPNIFSKSR